MKLIIVSVIMLSASFLFGAAAPESIVNCAFYSKLNDQDLSIELRSYAINSNYEVAIFGDETCAIIGKFRVVLDPTNHGISINIADVSNSAGLVNKAACQYQDNPPMGMGFPYYTPIVATLYQRLPKDVSARAISTHGFTGLQYVSGRDGKGGLQFHCD